jgi:2-keto-4-pentenoate hydratase
LALGAEQAAAAETQLYHLWRDGGATDALPAELRPTTREDGYAIQARLEARTAFALYGWKIAATSGAGQAHIGVDGPLAGRLLRERVLEPGAVCALGTNRMRVAELEFAFRIGEALARRPAPWTPDEVLERVAALHLAIEVPDSRFVAFETVGAPQLIADNACAHRFLLGREVSADWRAADLAAHAVEGRVNGGAPVLGAGANVLGHPVVALTWLVNELSGLGLTLQPGQIVITGTCVQPLPIAAGDRVVGDFGAFGTVEVCFAP